MNESYKGLPTLAYLIRWIEELVALMSKPLLMVGFIVSMLDLLTQGKLLDNALVFYGWALIQAVAVDACFFVIWHRVKVAFGQQRWGAMSINILLGLALGLVTWAALDLQSLQQILGISSSDALARLGLNPVVLVHLRSGVAVVMGAVVAMLSPQSQVTTLERHTEASEKTVVTQEVTTVTLETDEETPHVLPETTGTREEQLEQASVTDTGMTEPATLLPTVAGVTDEDVRRVVEAAMAGIPRREMCSYLRWGSNKYSNIVKPVLDVWEHTEQQQ